MQKSKVISPANNDANRGEKRTSASLFPPAPSKLEGALANARSSLSPGHLDPGATTYKNKVTLFVAVVQQLVTVKWRLVTF